MTISNLALYSIGFLAQAFFSARILVQWILSERAKRVLSPSLFWILSIAGAFLLSIYGWLRHDFAVVLGQFISYYIYIANLNMKGLWHRVPIAIRVLLLLTPAVVISLTADNAADFVTRFFKNDDIPMWLVVYGSFGQVLFTLRFIYQWIVSRSDGESVLPPGFWILSLIGSAVILSYAVIRVDPVLMLGQSVGLIAYVRNLMIGYKASHTAK